MRNIKLFQELRARPARVFQALTDPKDLSAWQADVVRGRVEVGRTLELEWPKLGTQLTLSVEELVPGRRVVFASLEGTLELSVAQGGLELRHSGPFDDESRAGTESSWRLALALLSTYLTRHVDRTRRVHWAVTRARATVELCHAYFTDAHLLASWLGQAEGSIGPAASSVSLSLGGRRARSLVLVNTSGRDVALRWRDADDSVLVMRTLPGPDEGERVILLGWSRWTDFPDAASITGELDHAVERLGRRLDAVPHV